MNSRACIRAALMLTYRGQRICITECAFRVSQSDKKQTYKLVEGMREAEEKEGEIKRERERERGTASFARLAGVTQTCAYAPKYVVKDNIRSADTW